MRPNDESCRADAGGSQSKSAHAHIATTATPALRDDGRRTARAPIEWFHPYPPPQTTNPVRIVATRTTDHNRVAR
jgi:hypothetical protein